MFKMIIISLFLPVSAFAEAVKIDWKPCENEIKEYCTTITADHEKHECLEDALKDLKGAAKEKSAKCMKHNQGLEKQFADKHEHKKEHSH